LSRDKRDSETPPYSIRSTSGNPMQNYNMLKLFHQFKYYVK
jgi:hypothetical protein